MLADLRVQGLHGLRMRLRRTLLLLLLLVLELVHMRPHQLGMALRLCLEIIERVLHHRKGFGMNYRRTPTRPTHMWHVTAFVVQEFCSAICSAAFRYLRAAPGRQASKPTHKVD